MEWADEAIALCRRGSGSATARAVTAMRDLVNPVELGTGGAAQERHVETAALAEWRVAGPIISEEMD